MKTKVKPAQTEIPSQQKTLFTSSGIRLDRTSLSHAVILALSLLLALVISLAGSAPLHAAGNKTILIGGTGSAIGVMKKLAAAFEKKYPEITVSIIPQLGTRGGINGVHKGVIDIGLAGRALTPQEMTQGLQGFEYARSPLVFVTHKKGKPTSLTYEMIVDIYRGEIKKWPDGTPLRPILRPTGDIDILMLKAISPALQEAVEQAEAREGMVFALDDQENCDLLEKIPGAFGVSTLTQIMTENRALTVLPLNGILPVDAGSAAGRYPHAKIFQMVTGPRSSPLTAQFIAFVKSAEGRGILIQNGNQLPEGE